MIIVDDVDGEVFLIFVLNKICGIFNVVVVKVFGFGDCCKVMFEDIVILIGGIVIIEDLGFELKDVIIEVFG